MPPVSPVDCDRGSGDRRGPTWADPSLGARPAAATAVQLYTEEYTYDDVGNIEEFTHKVGGTVSWRRLYEYDGEPTSSPRSNNRLARTTIPGSSSTWETYVHAARGNIVDFAHLYRDGAGTPNITVDFRDQMTRARKSAVDDSRYFYDAGGQRVRKYTKAGANTLDRKYIGEWEVWSRKTTTVQDIRETLHVLDGDQRICMVETSTWSGGAAVTPPVTVLRYQLTNHLGTSVLELTGAAAIISYEEYHPYGSTAWWTFDSATQVSQKRYRWFAGCVSAEPPRTTSPGARRPDTGGRRRLTAATPTPPGPGRMVRVPRSPPSALETVIPVDAGNIWVEDGSTPALRISTG